MWDGSEGAFPTQAAAKAAFLDALKSADVIIDETYFADSTKVDSAAMLKEWGLTEAEAAAVPAIANKKVCGVGGWVGGVGDTCGGLPAALWWVSWRAGALCLAPVPLSRRCNAGQQHLRPTPPAGVP